MPIPLPNYDDRRWTDLVAEALAMIPGLDATWTDFNVHDPGVTLIELVSWLVEGEIHRLNRVPDRHVRKFLELVDRPPRPPVAARLAAGLASSAAAPAGFGPPVGLEFQATAMDGSTLGFRSLAPLDPILPPLTVALVQTDAASAPVDRTADLTRAGRLIAFGDNPTPGAALWLGFGSTAADAVPGGGAARLHFQFRSGRSGPDERARIVAEMEAQRRACQRPAVAPPCREEEAATDRTPPAPLIHHDARIAWDYHGPAGWTTLDPAAGQVRDETRALTLDGPVTIQPPAPGWGGPPPGQSAPFWARVRLVSGAFDAPPTIGRVIVNALDLEQAVDSIGRHVIAPGAVVTGAPKATPGPARLSLRYGEDDAIVSLGFDQDPAAPEFEVLGHRPATATARGLLAIDAVLLGRSDGTPDQSFTLPDAPLQGGSARVETLEPPTTAGGPWTWRAWRRRADFDAATRTDAWVTVDEVAGALRFGNGARGRIPPPGSRVLARWRATAGATGNIRAGTLSGTAPSLRNWLLLDARVAPPSQRFAAADLDAALGADPKTAWADLAPIGYAAVAGPLAAPALSQPEAASGGADAEDLATAAAAAAVALGEPTRAITAADHLALTWRTPGTILARAEVVAGRHPNLPGLRAPGVVTVVIAPKGPPRPSPSPGLLEAVRRHLDRRRIVGSHVAVIGPSYLIVSVSAVVQTATGARASRVLADVAAALNAFLDPLGGGPAVIAAMNAGRGPALAQTTPAATSIFGDVRAVGPTAGSPLPGVQLLAATPPAGPRPAASPAPPPGWPLGRTVYRAEVLQVIQSVAGVDHVEALELSGDGGAPSCGNLCVGPFQLVAPGAHSITVH